MSCLFPPVSPFPAVGQKSRLPPGGLLVALAAAGPASADVPEELAAAWPRCRPTLPSSVGSSARGAVRRLHRKQRLRQAQGTAGPEAGPRLLGRTAGDARQPGLDVPHVPGVAGKRGGGRTAGRHGGPDTFLYGEPSCVAFVELLRKLQQAQQTAQMLEQAGGDGALELEELEMIEDDIEAAVGGGRIVPVSRQVGWTSRSRCRWEWGRRGPRHDPRRQPRPAGGPRSGLGLQDDQAGGRQVSVKRLEVLATMLVNAIPDLAGSLERRKIRGG